ncbi:MAG: hypothetical protein A3C30_00580 [Candidatus Levybacteria bacterium RIFCSPHIGHO2_02_FULL_40_18]|nr:MAG: hypothetical protein A2869_03350 [Candidatus Levybacteria bacterium RIFCSPHIGHO2_01_FULL_40_58]OGH27196.1 MAG: hypothetical protein A3C30_00580 [Candidatus Levybacteria bacterium RIFCSPHIGHO2_02_FULL_40_18]OGH31055.1 MAG: hypothetical protein A3E43_04995 [Candidatus Levybacteria bacterium RIFCSPHIGHO2_12_FULL_40_31]OGH40777.1 MAG: hypothetical protein A2894_03445 [Candidatus Levybacteria bacterium RIFCSPLOWO2_01_FULL_40_64]OGH49415.1 MAG: hypothetical protein A3I54_02085 [Candidatus Lev
MGKITSRILILNWRDIKNPGAGGAEILTHEMAKFWVSWGHSVTQISAGFDKAKNQEVIDGIKIIRLGRWWSVHLLAFFYYFKNLHGKVDVIIDEVHGIPFFAALYEPRKTILFACEVADKLFFQVFSAPLAYIGILIERIYFNLYKKIPTLAISSSTMEDLISRGFKKKNITVLPMGLTVPHRLHKLSKEKVPTIIYLSRINKQKGIEDAIEAFKIINEAIPDSRLWVVGSGVPEYVAKIKNKVKGYKLSRAVKFFGFVSESQKFKLLSRAHLMIFPSIHEGWGIVIAEAGVCGTPSAVYNAPGVRDVVENGSRGIMVEKYHPDLLGKAMVRYLKNDKLYTSLLSKIKSFEKEIGWENTAKVAFSVIAKYENRKS